MDWDTDLPAWPLHEHSRRLKVNPHRWHVQCLGNGDDTLLIHGAGGTTQSWHRLIPFLTPAHRIIAPDLPGQGFTTAGTPGRYGLAETAADLWALMDSGGWRPRLIVGHSAGAAIALEMVRIRPGAAVVGINAALGRFNGVAGWLYPALARLLARLPFVADIFSRISGRENAVRQLLASTGSAIDDEMLALYTRLVRDRSHVDGSLQMMAAWDLGDLLDNLPGLDSHVLLLAAQGDRTVPPGISEWAAAKMPNARLELMNTVGHLAHEEQPGLIAAHISAFCITLNGMRLTT
ncbi:MAG: alpha/beta fold hydrolase [Rhodobacteraceae bacterium]|nr:alpha/beta fold hydrolase [Paracoccaceae bacterium]